jgi:hypothetical protein
MWLRGESISKLQHDAMTVYYLVLGYCPDLESLAVFFCGNAVSPRSGYARHPHIQARAVSRSNPAA